MRPTFEVETRQPSRLRSTTNLSLPQLGYGSAAAGLAELAVLSRSVVVAGEGGGNDLAGSTGPGDHSDASSGRKSAG